MADTILTRDLIDRLGPYISYPRIDGDKVRAEGGGASLNYKMYAPDTVPSISHEYKIGDGNAVVRRQVLKKPDLDAKHRMLFHVPLSIAGGKSDYVRAELDNLTSSEAKRILRALEENPKLLQSLSDVPFVKDYKGKWGNFYHMAEDPKGNLSNWVGELWDAQKKVNKDELQSVLYPNLKYHHKKVQEKLYDVLTKRVHKSNALMTAGMGLAGALAGDEDSRIKTSVLSALGASLGTYGSAFASRFAPSDKLQAKLHHLLARRPGLRMGVGAIGGLAGILAGKGTSSSPEGGVMDELADKVEDLTGADVKGSDMLKYILLGGGGLAALGGLGYAATRKKKKKSEEKRDA